MTRWRLRVIVLGGAMLIAPVMAQPSASLAGVVVSEPGAQPVRQALVTVAGEGLAQSRSVVADDAGRFLFENLPAGRFTVSASKPAYVSNAVGARRPGRPGTPMPIAAGQRLTDVRVILPRGAVITGTIRDANGEPAEGVSVAAVPVDALRWAPGTLLRPDTVATDDRGVYRIFGLSPGEYVVYVSLRVFGSSEMSVRSSAEIDAALKQLTQGQGRGAGLESRRTAVIAPTFHPGTARIADAGRVTVGVGEERAAVDITFATVPVATIEGTILYHDGSPATGLSVSLDLEGPRLDSTGGLMMQSPLTGAGRFTWRGVMPGTYVITARSPGHLARARVDVNGEDVRGLMVPLRPEPKVTGRVIFGAAAVKPPSDVPRYFVHLLALGEGVATSAPVVSVPSASAPVSPDGTFTMTGALPGRYWFTVALPPGSGWTLRSAMLGGRDLADFGVEVGETDLSGLIVTMTDRTTELSGTLQTDAGAAATEYAVVVIPADRSLWLPSSRRMKVARLGTDGRFVIRDLPAGEYLLAAGGDIEQEDLRDRALLETIALGAVRVTLAEGDRKVQDLKIVR
jgi:hypothetical protein